MVTVSWGVILVAASVALANQQTTLTLLLVLVAVLLDVVDGAMARKRNQPSVSGTLLEQIAHWVGNMALSAGAGASILLADPCPRNILLASSLSVTQSIYIAAVRQIRPSVANIPEHPHIRRSFRIITQFFWILSPIEIPLAIAFAVFGINETTVFVTTLTLATSSLLIFVPHFMLVRAVDRRLWETATTKPIDAPPIHSVAYGEAIVERHFPDARWWTPSTPRLPPPIMTLLGRQSMSTQAPILGAVWLELSELLPKLFRTSGRALPLACPTEAAIEAVLAAVCRPGDEILLVGGRDSIATWSRTAQALDVRTIELLKPFGKALQPDAIQSALEQDGPFRAVCIPLSENEDSSSQDLAMVAAIIQERPELLIVDASVGLCADDLRMDEWGIDFAVSCSNSGVMAPSGLSLIAIASDKVQTLTSQPKDANRTGSYLSLRDHLATTGNPVAPLPAQALSGLYASTQMILAASIDVILTHRSRLAERFRRGIAEKTELKLVAERPSSACTSASLPYDVDLEQLQGHLFAAKSLIVATRTSPDGKIVLQFGHVGWLFDNDIDEVVDTLATALRATRTEQ